MVWWAHSLDEAVVAAGVQHSKEWFGERLSEAAVRAIHVAPILLPTRSISVPRGFWWGWGWGARGGGEMGRCYNTRAAGLQPVCT